MLYFTRHGESEANIEKIFSNKGFKHPLTTTGINQTQELAKKLVDKNIHKIISSPILRAIQTASLIAAHLHINTFEVHENLREYDVGVLEGKLDKKSWKLYFQNEQNWKDLNKRNCHLPAGESYLEIQKRFSNFIIQVTNDIYNKDRNILIITHGGLLKIGLSSMCLNVDYEFACNNPITNCELIVCEDIENRLKCHSWGNISFI